MRGSKVFIIYNVLFENDTREDNLLGIFSVPVKMRNWQNRFLPPEQQGQEVSCDMLVDSGAAELALPAEIMDSLKLEELGDMRVVTADGTQRECRVLGMVELEVQGRVCQVRAIELPRGTQPLLGAVPLEEMDWHIRSVRTKTGPQSAFPPTSRCCTCDERPFGPAHHARPDCLRRRRHPVGQRSLL